MKQKIFQLLGILLFFIIFAYFYGNAYWQHQEKFEKQISYKHITEEKLKSFSFDTLEKYTDVQELYVTPDGGVLDMLINEIESAQEKIYVEVYIFTEKRLRDALIAAHKRGVEVKILLENNPYQAPYLNDSHFNDFLNAEVDVRWSDPLNYSLNHSKLLLIDERAYVSTGNFSYSLFTKNRDFLVSIGDGDLFEALEQLFLQDFSHEASGVYHDSLVLSPEYSRTKLSLLVLGAQETLDIYFPYMQDDIFEQNLFAASERGVFVRLLVDKVFYNENPDTITRFREKGIHIEYLQGQKLHAKAILADKKYLYIGSINFSTYSFDKNREVGIITSQTSIITDFLKVFDEDFILY